jgi:hypothetical protein
VRAISAETGIPVGTVHRAKRQLEKNAARGRQNAAGIAQQLPTSYVVKQDIGSVPQDVRRLIVAVYEHPVERAIGRRLLVGVIGTTRELTFAKRRSDLRGNPRMEKSLRGRRGILSSSKERSNS